MGRLTLNMLLSFAQFEREIAGERVRDKKLAMTKKGMWVNGRPPHGYKVEKCILSPDPKLKEEVLLIFEKYLEFKITDVAHRVGIQHRIGEKLAERASL